MWDVNKCLLSPAVGGSEEGVVFSPQPVPGGLRVWAASSQGPEQLSWNQTPRNHPSLLSCWRGGSPFSLITFLLGPLWTPVLGSHDEILAVSLTCLPIHTLNLVAKFFGSIVSNERVLSHPPAAALNFLYVTLPFTLSIVVTELVSLILVFPHFNPSLTKIDYITKIMSHFAWE